MCLSFLRIKKEINDWLITTLEDPLIRTLAENSNLTKTQLETFLIDVLAEDVVGQDINYEQKSRLRLNEKDVSRGSFNRTLHQAQRNIIQSIYTILLLGCLGVFETPRLDQYLKMSNRLSVYIEKYRKVWKNLAQKGTSKEKMLKLTMLRKELKSSLKELAVPNKLSKREAKKIND
jgi:hypothetical protein